MKYFIQKILCNPDMYSLTPVYSQLWYILKLKHIQNSAEYLRWSILLRTLFNYSKFRHPIYSKFAHIQNLRVSATPECISFSLEIVTSPLT